MNTSILLPALAAEFLPHEAPMALIDQLVVAAGESGRASAILGPDHLFLTEAGELDEVAFPELVAQAYAALRGHELRSAGLPLQPGFLVGIQKCDVLTPARRGDRLEIDVRTVGKFSGFAVVEGNVTREGNILATAKIKLYIPGEAEEGHDA
ncbi:hypothetical protein [Paucidesulfovibrio longus]|uniref:hypothetical protein n=1 Tax=Paucidesulfovibrio longus TaxID=889 RepID=UPI0003B77DD6|nr:hypothetical protein [Paucidesulfovibrio longus]